MSVDSAKETKQLGADCCGDDACVVVVMCDAKGVHQEVKSATASVVSVVSAATSSVVAALPAADCPAAAAAASQVSQNAPAFPPGFPLY